MPYKAFSENGKFVVYKLDMDDKPMGKALGKHDDKAAANRQVKALYAAEEKEQDEKAVYEMTGDDGYSNMHWLPSGIVSFAEYDAMADAKEQAIQVKNDASLFKAMVDNILEIEPGEGMDKSALIVTLAGEFINRIQMEDKEIDDDRDDELKAVWTTKFINNLPDSSFLYVEKDCGDKDGEGKTKPRSCRHFPYKDASGKVDLPHLRNAIARIPQSNVAGLNKEALQSKARKMLENAQKEIGEETLIERIANKVKEFLNPSQSVSPSSYIWKDANGQYRWLAAYTNNFRDNDNPPEIISSAAHKEFDQAVNKGEWPMPQVWLWHYPYLVGQTQTHHYDEKSGFCIAGGTFDKDKSWAAEAIIQRGWTGVSHGMPKAHIKRDEKDKSIILSRRTREISFLPASRAANQMAFHIISKESEMDENKEIPAHKREEFVKTFGEERVAEMEAEIAQRSQQAKEDGAESKEATPEQTPQQAPAELPADVANALQLIADTINQVNETVKAIDNRVKELEKDETERLAQKAAGIPQATLADLVKSRLFSQENEVKDKGAGPQQNESKRDGSSGLFFEELGWTSPVRGQ